MSDLPGQMRRYSVNVGETRARQQARNLPSFVFAVERDITGTVSASGSYSVRAGDFISLTDDVPVSCQTTGSF
jgi:hypothetical protein